MPPFDHAYCVYVVPVQIAGFVFKHAAVAPVRVTVGELFIVNDLDALAVQPLASVTVTV